MRANRPMMPILLLFFATQICTSWAQQSAAGQDTLIGIVGRDFVMMGADSSSSGGGGIALTSSNIDKIAVIHDGGGGLKLNGNGEGCDTNGESLEQQAIAVGFAGDAADGDRFVGMLKTHTQVREYEAGIGNDVLCVFDGKAESSKLAAIPGTLSPAGLDAEAIANLARKEISSRMRSRQPLQLCLLVGGMVRCNNPAGAPSEIGVVDRVQKQVLAGSAAYKSKSNHHTTEEVESTNMNAIISGLDEDVPKSINPLLTPKLFWLDQYGSLQNMRYAAHGYGSNFAYSVLDQRYRSGMSRQEAVDLIRECFEQLSKRYVMNSPRPPRIKCIDTLGVTDVSDDTVKLE